MMFLNDNCVWSYLLLVCIPYIEHKKATAPARLSRLQEQMEKTRAEQQKNVQLKSDQAKLLRKSSNSFAQEKKSLRKDEHHEKNGRYKSDSSKKQHISSYNPMMPSTSSSGSSYR